MDAAELEIIPLFADLPLDQRASVARACDTLQVDEGTVSCVKGTPAARAGGAGGGGGASRHDRYAHRR